MFFAEHIRPDVKKENAELKFGEIGKIIGERWKKVTEDDKKNFNAMAEKDKERYKKELEAWEAEHGPLEKKEKKSKKKKQKSSDDEGGGSDKDTKDDGGKSDDEQHTTADDGGGQSGGQTNTAKAGGDHEDDE